MESVLAAWPVDSVAAVAHAHHDLGQRVLARGDRARVQLEQLDARRPSAASAALRAASSGPLPTAEAERRCAVHLDLDGRRGQELVAGDHLVAHELHAALGRAGHEGQQVVVVDELLAVGQLLHARR